MAGGTRLSCPAPARSTAGWPHAPHRHYGCASSAPGVYQKQSPSPMRSPQQSTVLSFPGKWGQLHLVSIFCRILSIPLSQGGRVAALGEPLPAAISPSACHGHRAALERAVNSRK